MWARIEEDPRLNVTTLITVILVPCKKQEWKSIPGENNSTRGKMKIP